MLNVINMLIIFWLVILTECSRIKVAIMFLVLKAIFVTGLLLLISGCTAGRLSTVDQQELLKDGYFPHAQNHVIETAEQVFSLSPEAQQFVINSQNANEKQLENIRGLVQAFFDEEQAGIRYLTNANTVAADTFANREANCLSLTIMAFAMAEFAGFYPTLYEVKIPEYWVRREGTSLLNGHVNLRITVPTGIRKTVPSKNYVDVDFDPQTIRQRFPRIQVSKQKILAMFYNNKGADALLVGDESLAYRYFSEAASVYPGVGGTWANLGVLYRRAGAYRAAEASYQQAIALDEENFTAWENLALLYELQGKNSDAEEIMTTLKAKRDNNPFYHFMLGEEAYELGKSELALKHYSRAMRLNRQRHEILFGLGKTYFELGEIDKAATYIKLAARFAPGRHDEKRYLSKLPSLQSAL